jgi:hypothetical protein
VGPWRVVAPASRGAWGSVYRVERVGFQLAGPFALKLATWPKDPRFEREVVMDWVEGLPLYEWAVRHAASLRQRLEVLSQLAQALVAVHAVSGLHRDVKGDNVLVRTADMQALLTDFGASTFHGAPPLTSEDLPPGTPGYRSPEAIRHRLQWSQSSGTHYEATPADDVFALGVTAWRLITGTYPPPVEAARMPEGTLDVRVPPPPLGTLPNVLPELEECLRRMLSEEPSERGTASEIAETLAHAARALASRATLPYSENGDLAASIHRQPRSQFLPALKRGPWRVAATASVLLLLGAWWAAGSFGDALLEGWKALHLGVRAGRTVGILDTASTVPAAAAMPKRSQTPVAEDMPKEPFPDQRRAPCKLSYEVAIHSACWLLIGNKKPPCGEEAFEWKGACYVPSYLRGRPTTSGKP